MEKFPISFTILVLIFGLMIGSVLGSLFSQVFGLEFLNRPLFGDPVKIANDFYIFKTIELQFTPASIIGLLVSCWTVFRKMRKG